MAVNDKRDQELLADYATGGSEEAFAELVRRYLNLVYSAAFRMVRNPHLAQEVTQSVFVALSQNARSLTRRPVLSGWLYRTAQNLAAKAVRTEVRRRAREHEAVAMNEITSTETEPAWELIAPHLDFALGQLRASDRDVVLLRFFERRSMGEIAHTLGLSEAAAQKRVARALEKLRSTFIARGITSSPVLIAAALTAHSVEAAPIELAATVANTLSAAATGSATAGSLSSILKLVAMTKFQAGVLGLLFAAGIATPVLVGFGSNQRGGTHTGAGLREDASGALQTSRQTVSALDGAANPRGQTNSPLTRLHAFLRQTDQGRSVWGGLTHEEDQELEFLVWSLPAADYSKALGFRNELRREQLRSAFAKTLAGYWSELNPSAALAAVQPVPELSGWLVAEILRKWAAKNPSAALAWVRQSATEAVHDSALAQVLPELARTDPQGAIGALDEMSPGMAKQRTFSELLNQWAAQDPATAANYVTNLPFSTQRSKLMASVAVSWAKKDFGAVLSWAEKLPEPDQAGVRDATLRVLEEKDPARAAAMLLELATSPGTARAIQNWAHETSAGTIPALDGISRTVQNWAKADLGGAAQWVQQLPEGKFRDFALGGLLEEWKNSDPRNAAEFLAAAATDGANGGYPIWHVLSTWAGKDSQAAADWAKRLPDGPVRDAALNSICGALALSKPTEAAGFVASLPPGEEQSRLAASVAVGWACNDPLAAIQWVAAFPAGTARSRAIEEVGRFLQNGGGNLDPCRRWLSGTSLLSVDEKQTLLGK